MPSANFVQLLESSKYVKFGQMKDLPRMIHTGASRSRDVFPVFMLPTSCAACRFLHDIAFGMSIVARGLRTNTDLLDEDAAAQPAAEAAPSEAQKAGGPKQQPLQLLLHVSNLSVLLPASSK